MDCETNQVVTQNKRLWHKKTVLTRKKGKAGQHNKNDPKEGLGVISKMDEKGNYQTVTPEEKNENSFLKFDKNSSILENFIKNFWSQLKEPTHFRLIRMTFNDYKQNKQALKDLAEGKKTDAVKEFLKRYEIVPKVNNQKNSTGT